MKTVLHFGLSFFIEFGALLVFLYTSIFYDFFFGVKVLMFLTFVSFFVSWWRDRRIPVFALISTVGILISGTLSLYFQNAYFVVLEYTLYNLVFGLFTIAGYWTGRPLMKYLFHRMFDITDAGWQELSKRWGIFFLICVFLNEFFWHVYGEHVWLWYRVVILVISLLFSFYQFKLTKQERNSTANAYGLRVFP